MALRGHTAAMSTHIALLRGINVGGHRKVPMAALRALCTKLGFGDVSTYVQSGNVVLTSSESPADVATALERGIVERFGFEVDVVVVGAEHWRRMLEQNPLADEAARDPAHTTLLLFKRPPPDGFAARLQERGRDGEVVRAVGDALYLHFPRGQARSKVVGCIDRDAGSPGTMRNWNTVIALDSLAARIVNR